MIKIAITIAMGIIEIDFMNISEFSITLLFTDTLFERLSIVMPIAL
jgi:hypothetical protein